MAEDWSAVAAEVEGALREIGDVSQSGGYPVTLRKVKVTGGTPWNPESGTETITYHELVGYETNQELRDVNGTLIGQTKRTITVNATGAVPSEDDTIAPGMIEAEVGEDTAWREVLAVRPLAPAGKAVLYEIDVQR